VLDQSSFPVEAIENRLALENTQPSFENFENALRDGLPQICGSPSPQCFKVVLGGYEEVDRIISGTYCHPLLIPHIGCWISANFAVMVSDIVEH